jgi:hypothetical protein
MVARERRVESRADEERALGMRIRLSEDVFGVCALAFVYLDEEITIEQVIRRFERRTTCILHPLIRQINGYITFGAISVWYGEPRRSTLAITGMIGALGQVLTDTESFSVWRNHFHWGKLLFDFDNHLAAALKSEHHEADYGKPHGSGAAIHHDHAVALTLSAAAAESGFLTRLEVTPGGSRSSP